MFGKPKKIGELVYDICWKDRQYPDNVISTLVHNLVRFRATEHGTSKDISSFMRGRISHAVEATIDNTEKVVINVVKNYKPGDCLQCELKKAFKNYKEGN